MTDLSRLPLDALRDKQNELKRQIRIHYRPLTPLQRELVMVTAEIVSREKRITQPRAMVEAV